MARSARPVKPARGGAVRTAETGSVMFYDLPGTGRTFVSTSFLDGKAGHIGCQSEWSWHAVALQVRRTASGSYLIRVALGWCRTHAPTLSAGRSIMIGVPAKRNVIISI